MDAIEQMASKVSFDDAGNQQSLSMACRALIHEIGNVEVDIEPDIPARSDCGRIGTLYLYSNLFVH